MASLPLAQACSEPSPFQVVKVYLARRHPRKPVQIKSLASSAQQQQRLETRQRRPLQEVKMTATNQNPCLETQRLSQVGCLGQQLQRAHQVDFLVLSHPKLVPYSVQRRPAQPLGEVFSAKQTLAPRCSALVPVQASRHLEHHQLQARQMMRREATMTKLRMRVKSRLPSTQVTHPRLSSRELLLRKPSNQIHTRSCSR